MAWAQRKAIRGSDDTAGSENSPPAHEEEVRRMMQ